MGHTENELSDLIKMAAKTNQSFLVTWDWKHISYFLRPDNNKLTT